MKKLMILIIITAFAAIFAREVNLKYKELTEQEKKVIIDKGTEAPFTGIYNNHYDKGIYKCKRCGSALYRSDAKFKSGCGWPSFDEEIKDAVKHKPDADGRRTEILCASCGAHLGHVFIGEGFTDKNTRHCVNSISLDFEPEQQTKTAYVAGGCFWGVEYYMQQLPGVISTESGYMGGNKNDPDYYQVSTGNTGHAETVKISYDPQKISYEQIIKRFFEIHDPTQLNQQGPDFGTQYRSAIFYQTEQELQIINKLTGTLEDKGYQVITEVVMANKFFRAERYHQDYYQKRNSTPYCHREVLRFD